MTSTQDNLSGTDVVEQKSAIAEKYEFFIYYLFTTVILTCAIYNAVYLDLNILKYSTKIVLTCLSIVAAIYLSSSVLKTIHSLPAIFLFMLISITTGNIFLNNVIYILLAVSLAYTLFKMWNARQKLLILLVSIITALISCSIHGIYANFNIIQSCFNNMVHIDTLFHASISAMIKNYNTVSTGLNGLVEINYHALSHYIMAFISTISVSGILETYGVAGPSFLVPMLFASILFLCIYYDKKRLDFYSIIIRLLLLVFFLIIMPMYGEWCCLWNSFFVSESYTLSLILFNFATIILYKKELSWNDILLSTIYGLLITSSKISVGFILGLLWVSRLVFFEKCVNIKILALICILASYGAYCAIPSTAQAASEPLLSPFSFFYLYSKPTLYTARFFNESGMLNSFLHYYFIVLSIILTIFGHFCVTIGVIIYSIVKFGIKNCTKKQYFIYSVISLVAGASILCLLHVPGGSQYYFSNVAFWVSLPIAINWLSAFFYKSHFKLNGYSCRGIIIITAISLCCVGFSYKITKKAVANLRTINTSNNSFVETIIKLRTVGKDICFSANSDLLASNAISHELNALPFAYPALSEHPWTNVIIPLKNFKYSYYGYPYYGVTQPGQGAVGAPLLRPQMFILPISLEKTVNN